jgi:hypothetical protein
MAVRQAAFAATVVVLTALPAAAQRFAPGEPSPGRVATVRTIAPVNMRGGPGPQYRVLLRIPAARTLQLLGCVPNLSWCRTVYLGRTGWVSSSLLVPRPGAGRVPPPPLPTPQPGQVTVHGTLTREGVECSAMRADNGRLYTLTPTTGRFQPGDRVTVRGTIVQVSFCQQGTTIRVQAIAPG